MQEMSLFGISLADSGGRPLLLLKTAEGRRFLPIWIGYPEAAAILALLEEVDLHRPLTHDLAGSVLAELGAEIVRVAITAEEEGTYYASITLATSEAIELELDARPSDAIALALRAEAPILAAEAVIELCAVEVETEQGDEARTLEEFRAFLDEVSPEEFGFS